MNLKRILQWMCWSVAILLGGILLVTTPGTVRAHIPYLETNPNPRIIPTTQEVKVYFGHPHAPETFYEGKDIWVEDATLYKPDGTSEKLEFQAEANNLTSTVTLNQKGAYIILVKMGPFVYDPAWHGTPGSVRLSENYAQVMIYTGGLENWDRVIGQGAEIVPLVNPYYLLEGEEFQAKFLYNGEPVRGSYAAAHEAKDIHDPDVAQMGETAEDGTFSITITEPGMWLIKAEQIADESGVWEATWTPHEDWYAVGETLEYDRVKHQNTITVWAAPAAPAIEEVGVSGWTYAAFIIAIVALLIGVASLALKRRR